MKEFRLPEKQRGKGKQKFRVWKDTIRMMMPMIAMTRHRKRKIGGGGVRQGRNEALTGVSPVMMIVWKQERRNLKQGR